MIGKAVNFVVIAGVPLTIYFMLYADESILFLAGEGYEGSVMPMIVLMPTVLLIGLSNITGIQVLTPQNMEQKVLNSIVAGAATDFVLNLVLIPSFASTGAGLATLAAEAVVLIIQCVYLKDILREITREVSLGKVVLAAMLGTAAGVFIKVTVDLGAFLTLVVSACVFFGVYGVVLLVTKEKFVWEILDGYLGKLKRK